MTNTTFPLSPATVQDGKYTLDMFVKEPARVSRFISDAVQADLVSQKLFRSVTAQGGAILFDRVTSSDDGAVQVPGVIAPGAEFPMLSFGHGEPVVERVVKTGGKYVVTREAMLRNDPALLLDKARKVARRMVRDIDQRAIGSLTNVRVVGERDSMLPRPQEVTSGGWKSATQVKSSAKSAVTGDGQIISELLDAIALIEDKDLGYRPDLLLLSPGDAVNLKKLLGIREWSQVLQDLGLSLHTTSALQPGDGIVTQSHAVGVIGVEDPVTTDTEYLKATQVTAFYTWASMAFGITDPYAMAMLKGLNK